MLKTRIISAVIGIPLFLGILYLGGRYWQLLFVLMAIAALKEYLTMCRNINIKPITVPAYCLMLVLLLRMELGEYLPLMVISAVLLMVAIIVTRFSAYNYQDAVFSFFGAFYIGFLLSYAMALNIVEDAFVLVVLALCLTWASDIGGYMFGRLWGKNKLAPQLSPNKTWEGAIGGVILPALVGVIYIALVPTSISIGWAALLGAAMGITAEVGDLFVSAMKRYFMVKDTGNIIPGHGGVLDRFDSFILVIPVFFYCITYLTR